MDMTTAKTTGTSNKSGHLQISGVYPHLCAYTVEAGAFATKLDETGIGAIVP
jgi:hypothetical protein